MVGGEAADFQRASKLLQNIGKVGITVIRTSTEKFSRSRQSVLRIFWKSSKKQCLVEIFQNGNCAVNPRRDCGRPPVGVLTGTP